MKRATMAASADTEMGPQPDELRAALTRSIGRWTQSAEGDHATRILTLAFFRRDAPTGPGLCQVEPSVVLVAQGAKRLLVGDDAFSYGIERVLIASLDVPASSQVLKASKERPCLGLVMKLDLRVLAELVAQTHLPPPKDKAAAGTVVSAVTPTLLESFKRLIDLLDEPDAVEVLAPLVQREIHYRLLTGDHSGRLRSLAAVGSHSHLVARAIEWLKANYAAPLRIEELAERVHMSASSFHQHFRQLTSMSPLQYQKWLRLNEAKRLMLSEGNDAASAAFAVGYASPSQFSREYARLFGAPPKRDVESLRDKAARPLRATT